MIEGTLSDLLSGLVVVFSACADVFVIDNAMVNMLLKLTPQTCGLFFCLVSLRYDPNHAKIKDAKRDRISPAPLVTSLFSTLVDRSTQPSRYHWPAPMFRLTTRLKT